MVTDKHRQAKPEFPPKKSSYKSATEPPSIDITDIDGLFQRLSEASGQEPKTADPNPAFMKRLETDISNIFSQAYNQRQLLLKFFIWYTCILSSFVLTIVFIQIFARIYISDADNLEIVPQWVLYLLVIGMFGQFIGLLTIVTKKVWTFEPFFQHFLSVQSKHKTISSPEEND